MSSSPSAGLMPNATSKLPFRLFELMPRLQELTLMPRAKNSRWMDVLIDVDRFKRNVFWFVT